MPTPYELAFGDPALEARLDEIRAEAESRGVDDTDPDRFVLLSSAGALLRELRPAEADAEALLDLGHLLFHAYHFRRAGKPVYLLDRALARRLLATPPTVGTWAFVLPADAGYLRFPRHLVWARVTETAPPEALDGIFWTLAAETGGTPAGRRLEALLVLGLRHDRPGFSVADVSAALPAGAAGAGAAGEASGAGHWADLRARADAPDFANILPGGELSGLHGLVTEAEVLRLLSLCAWHMAAHPESISEERGPGEGAEQAPVGDDTGVPVPEHVYRVGESEASG